MTSAVVGLFEELETAPGQVVPIGKLEDVNRKEVSIEGRIRVLWESNSPAIAQVGLIERRERPNESDDLGEIQCFDGSRKASRFAFTGQHGTGTTGVSQSPSDWLDHGECSPSAVGGGR